MDNSFIGIRIKQRRKELGLTQIQIKEATGISSGNMSEIENGNKLPSTPALISLSKILNCSIDWILKGEDAILSNERLSENLNNNEETLLNIYRTTNDIGQPIIIQQAESVQKALPRMPELNQEQTSSDLKIG